MTTARAGNPFDHLVGVFEAPAEEVSDKRESRSHLQRSRGLPCNRFDVGVPRRHVVGIGRVGRDLFNRSINNGAGRHVDIHRSFKPQ